MVVSHTGVKIILFTTNEKTCPVITLQILFEQCP